MSSGKEIFNALNEQLKFATEGNDKKSTYKEVIGGQVWLYFGIADKNDGPYIGFWVDDSISAELKNVLKEALGELAANLNCGDIIEDGSWIYCSMAENIPSADEVVAAIGEMEGNVTANIASAHEEEPSDAPSDKPVTKERKSVFSRIFFWFKFAVFVGLIAAVVAAFLPEFTVRKVGPEELLADAEFAPRYKEAFKLDNTRTAPSGILAVFKSSSRPTHVYQLKWEFYTKKHAVVGAVMNEPHVKAFIYKMNGGFRVVLLVVAVFVGLVFMVSSGLMGGWAKQRKVTGKRYSKDGRVDDIYED